MFLAIALIVTYAIAIIAAGHGAGPVGMLLFLGNARVWGMGQMLGWFSILSLLLVSVFPVRDARKRAETQLLVSACLYLSWFAFAYTASEGPVFWGNVGAHFLFSAPFQITFFIVMVYLVRKLRASPKQDAETL